MLGKSDYERMKSLAINGQTIKETQTRSQLQQTIDRKQALHEKSLAETATWNHTIVVRPPQTSLPRASPPSPLYHRCGQAIFRFLGVK